MSEDIEKEVETEFFKYKKLTNKVFYEIENIEKKLIDAQVSFENGQRAQAAGVKNVYDKFIELEERQKRVEDLLNSERLEEVIKLIPTEDDINKLLDRIHASKFGKLNRHLEDIRKDLEELTSLFNY